MKKFEIVIMSIIFMSIFTSCDRSFKTVDYMTVNDTSTFQIVTLDEKNQVTINYDFKVELKNAKLVLHTDDDVIILDRDNGEWITSYIKDTYPVMLHVTDDNYKKLYKYF